jgi:hypothetical protein
MEQPMQTKSIIVALLAFSAGSGSAAPLTWQFTYTGLYDTLAKRFDSTHVLSGEFTGEDRNDDGAIDFAELESMLIYGERNYKGCQGEESPYYACGVGPFYFGPGNDLSFSLGEEFHDRPRLSGRGHRIDTGDRDWSYTIENGEVKPYRYYSWTGATTLQVSVVPEPQRWATLAGGIGVLLAMGAVRMRSRPSD